MTVERLEYLAKKVSILEMRVALQEPKKGYDKARKQLNDIYFELSDYHEKSTCEYFYISSAILERIYKIWDYIRDHE